MVTVRIGALGKCTQQPRRFSDGANRFVKVSNHNISWPWIIYSFLTANCTACRRQESGDHNPRDHRPGRVSVLECTFSTKSSAHLRLVSRPSCARLMTWMSIGS